MYSSETSTGHSRVKQYIMVISLILERIRRWASAADHLPSPQPLPSHLVGLHLLNINHSGGREKERIPEKEGSPHPVMFPVHMLEVTPALPIPTGLGARAHHLTKLLQSILRSCLHQSTGQKLGPALPNTLFSEKKDCLHYFSFTFTPGHN